MPFTCSKVASVEPPTLSNVRNMQSVVSPVSLRAKLTFGFVQGDLRLAPVVFNFVVQIELLWNTSFRHFGASA